MKITDKQLKVRKLNGKKVGKLPKGLVTDRQIEARRINAKIMGSKIRTVEWNKKVSDTLLKKYKEGKYPLTKAQKLARSNNFIKFNKSRKGIKRGTQSAEHLQKRLSKCCIRPNKFEVNALNYVNAIYDNKVKYTGDGSLIVNGKSVDAVLEGTKVVFLFNGVYWHLKRFGYEVTEENKRLIEAKESYPFISVGYKVVFVWEDEIKL